MTSTPTISSTILPSLEPTQVFEALQKFRNQGWDCPTPYFFGIIPERTTFNQAAGIFNWLNKPLSPWDLSDPRFYESVFTSNDLDIDVILEKDNNFVKNIRLRIGLHILYKGGTAYPQVQIWPAFSPATLISKYGYPTKVEFNIDGPHDIGAPSRYYYDMYLYFKHLDLTIAYWEAVFTDKKSLKVCPLTDPFTDMEVWFGKDPEYLPTGVSLEKATHITISQFSELMIQPSGSSCFELVMEGFLPTP